MRYDNFIDGKWTQPSTGEYADLTSPADASAVLGSFASSDAADAEAAVSAAQKAFRKWSETPGPDRGRILYRFADLLERNESDLAETLSREEGKILQESVGEVRRAAAETRFAAGEASRATGSHYVSERAGIEVFLKRIPLGPVAAITPWNFPIVTPVRKISPALAYGNTVIFKPPTITPFCAVKLVKLYAEAGVPEGVLNLVLGPGSKAGEAIASSPRVRGITFTGSTAVGKRIYANSVANLTKVQLEMGGKNPALVYGAENLDEAAAQIVSAAFAASGQRCTAISRVVVSAEEHDALIEALRKRVEAIVVGDSLDPKATMGPLVSRQQVEVCESYVGIAKKEGARIVAGGNRIDGPGHFFQATLVDGVARDSPLAREEIFGPILSVLTARSFDEGIDICNEPAYGLAGCVFTRDVARAKEFMHRMESGMVHVNHGTASQAHVPFGGVKESGFGAFSIGPTGAAFYTNEKVVYLK